MSNEQNTEAVVPKWNRFEVGRYLLPVLRCVDSRTDEDISDEHQNDRYEHAIEAIATAREAYAQLLRVYRTASPELLEKWFGWIECDDSLLDDAFDFIANEARDATAAPRVNYEKEMYLASMFRISEQGKTVDLAAPFEQYYYCDEVIYKDYLFRRVKLEDECRACLRRYLPYYNRIRAWYRENGGKASGVGAQYHAYMELIEYFQSRNAYEDSLRDERQALEYERGGLGWFHRARKREIDGELYELSLRELKLKIDDARERYEAYEAQFERSRQAWQDELASAPLTAFGRRKELKQKLSELDQNLTDYREQLGLDELRRQYRSKKKNGR